MVDKASVICLLSSSLVPSFLLNRIQTHCLLQSLKVLCPFIPHFPLCVFAFYCFIQLTASLHSCLLFPTESFAYTSRLISLLHGHINLAPFISLITIEINYFYNYLLMFTFSLSYKFYQCRSKYALGVSCSQQYIV